LRSIPKHHLIRESSIRSKRLLAFIFGILCAFVFSLGISMSSAAATSVSTTLPAPHNEASCTSERADGVTYHACIEEYDRERNPDILFAFVTGKPIGIPHESLPSLKRLYDEWERTGTPRPTLITVSFSQENENWTLAQKRLEDVRDLHAFFVNVLMARLEGRLRNSAPSGKPLVPKSGRRFLIGENSGGFNAAMLLLKNGSLFHKVALLCPHITTLDPFSGDGEIRSFLETTKADRESVERSLKWLRSEFPLPSLWAEHDLFNLASKRLSPNSPDLFISVAEDDPHGYAEGTRRFAALAQEKGPKVTTGLTKLAECPGKARALAEFFKPLN
jgi:hypothetical protein